MTLVMDPPVDALPVDLSNQVLDIMRRGARVRLRLRRWRGWVRLDNEDLGIEAPDDPEAKRAAQEMLKMGRKLVFLPLYMQRLASVEALARDNLREKSYKIWCGTFVPTELYGEFQERHTQLEADAREIVQEMITRLVDIRQQVVAIYTRLAHVAYCRMHPDADTAPDAFVVSYVQRVLARFPSAQELEEAFTFDFIPERVPLPESAPAVVEDADLLQKALEDDINRHWHDARIEHVDSFMADVVGQLRGRVFDVVSKAVGAMEKNDGFLPGKTVEGLTNLMTIVRKLDIYGDVELEAAFNQIKGQLDKPASQRDNTEIKGHLDALLTLTTASLIPLDKLPRKAKEADIQMPTIDDVRQARARFGVEDVAVPVVEVAVHRARREF